jgi:Ca-activated chloride channel family protein
VIFLSPERLFLLLVPVALLVAYLFAMRARQRAAVRFTDVDLLASVAPRRPGWQRHIPATLLLIALAVMTVGFAQPATEQRIPRDIASLVLVLDTSGSMAASDVEPTRLAAAQDKARAFVDELPDGLQVGLVTFSRDAQVVTSPTRDRAAVLAAIDSLQVGGGTGTAAGINTALDAIESLPPAASGQPAPAALVLMSDGTPTLGVDGLDAEQSADLAAIRAREAGIPVNAIAFGTPDGIVALPDGLLAVPYDPEAMERIAEQSGGQAFTAETSNELGEVYDRIGRDVAFSVETTEITAGFTGAALLLSALAAAAALYWNQRVV